MFEQNIRAEKLSPTYIHNISSIYEGNDSIMLLFIHQRVSSIAQHSFLAHILCGTALLLTILTGKVRGALTESTCGIASPKEHSACG